ncbi:VirB4 family type IV secretion system protein [Alkalicoccobacillus gibsonii]|uniref:VirB4 family type IV secretion system protein n=1 Tax=Alkalicoccobacillus gibsonii TaxID=79881 RepID=UPI00193341FD|nr:type IV secretion system protein VirB4 [Alkalicoccobacillus gibsonii]MBM0067957.1 type IV secretion system protein VirB4 [Alkalicoccobacillus gibsonii]
MSLLQERNQPNEQEKKKKKKHQMNDALLATIQPAGGVKFEESFIKKGDGYEACLHVYKYPKRANDFWLAPLFDIENCITTLDFAREDTFEIREAMNKSMAEQNARYIQETDNLNKMEARDAYDELASVYNAIRDDGDVIKSITLRMYVHGRTLVELEQHLANTVQFLENLDFRATVLLNEQEYEWKALFQGYSTQLKDYNKRQGKQLPSSVLAGSLPFYFTQLHDPYGSYFGQTNTNGYVILDVFHKDKQRPSYNGVVIGSMGSGKSTLLKKIASDRADRGDFIRGFDVTGEFRPMVEARGGKIISLDGSEGSINPLHVFKTHENQATCFTQHLSKVANFYRFIAPEATDMEIKEFENLTNQMYVEWGLWAEDESVRVTDRPSNEYPILSDLMMRIKQELYSDIEKEIMHENLSNNRMTRLENIILVLNTMVRTYGRLFNQHTSLDNFQAQQIVYFEIKSLAQMQSSVFQAQLFNVINLLWDELLQKGVPQYETFNRGELAVEDVVYYLIEIDEAHAIVNTKQESQAALGMLTNFARQARKYFGGIIFASHTIRDFVPEGSSMENIAAIKTLFNLSSYKFLMKQDAENVQQLRTVFNDELSDHEIQSIPMLETGSTILTIAGAGNIRFSIECSPEELALYGGGL